MAPQRHPASARNVPPGCPARGVPGAPAKRPCRVSTPIKAKQAMNGFVNFDPLSVCGTAQKARHCAACGCSLPAKKPRPSKSTGRRRSAPKNRAVHCLACRGVMTPCPVCGEPFTKTKSSVETCGPSCGAAKGMATRRARGDFSGPQTIRRRVPRAPKPQPVIEWRGSAIDKVRAIRGSI